MSLSFTRLAREESVKESFCEQWLDLYSFNDWRFGCREIWHLPFRLQVVDILRAIIRDSKFFRG